MEVRSPPSMSSQVASSAGNPAGPDPSYIGTINSFVLQSGVNAFAAAKAPSVLAANGVNQNYRISYQENFSLGIEQQLLEVLRPQPLRRMCEPDDRWSKRSLVLQTVAAHARHAR